MRSVPLLSPVFDRWRSWGTTKVAQTSKRQNFESGQPGCQIHTLNHTPYYLSSLVGDFKYSRCTKYHRSTKKEARSAQDLRNEERSISWMRWHGGSIGTHQIGVSWEQKGGREPAVREDSMVCGETVNSVTSLEYKMQGGRREIVCSTNADWAPSICRHCACCWGYSRGRASKELELSNILLPYSLK